MSLLILLLLSICPLVVSNSCVRDRDENHRLRVSCTSMGLSNIPPSLNLTTEVLNFTDNKFVSLAWSSYKDFPNIFTLDLSRNTVSELAKKSGLVLPTLRILRLSGNILREIPPDAFAAVANLTEIYLRANQLHTLSPHSFRGLYGLEVLDISQNLIRALPLKLLSWFTPDILKTFDMEDNRVTLMPNGFFEPMPTIPYVYLSKNPWECSCEVGYLTTWLEEQSFNVYMHTDPKTIVNDPESVVCNSPLRLKDRAILDLQEEEYCVPTPSHSPMGDSSIFSSSNAPVYESTESLLETTPSAPPALGITTTIQTSYITSSTTSVTEIMRTWWHSWTFHNILTYPTKTTVLSHEPESNWTIFHKPTTVQPVMSSTDSSTRTATIETTPTSKQSVSHTSPPSTATVTASVTETVTDSFARLNMSTGEFEEKVKRTGNRSVVLYCWWLFWIYLCLCVLLGLWLCAISLWLIRSYIRIYLPLSRQRRQVVNAVGGNRGWDAADRTGAISLPMEGAEGVQAVFRSVLFVSVSGEEEGEAGRSKETGRVDTAASGHVSGKEVETGGAEGRRETEGGEGWGGKEKEEVFRKTLYRVVSREGEIPGWSAVQKMRAPSEGVSERRQGVGESKTKYSLILREEKAESRSQSEERRDGQLMPSGNEWVVGEWEWRNTEGACGGGETREEDLWSLMPLVTRGMALLPRNTDDSIVTSVSTSETYL